MRRVSKKKPVILNSAVIQATQHSSLFPGKSLSVIGSKTVLEHIATRIREIPSISEIVLATSSTPQDDALTREAERLRIRVVRGSLSDVLARLCQAAEQCSGNAVLWVSGNYPLIDPLLAEELIISHRDGGFEFSYNEHANGTVHGTGCEVINKKLLFEANKRSLTAEQKESGILYFYQNESGLSVNRVPYPRPRPEYKVCFDTEKDLRLISFIFKKLRKPCTKQIIDLLDNNPILAESNRYEPVKEIGLEKFYLFPQKIAALHSSYKSDIDLTYPVTVELSLTNRCNFNCVWCSDRRIRKSYRGDLAFDVVRRLLLDLRNGGTRGIVIEGGGEPTLHPKFSDVVKLAHDQGLGVGLITNGSRPIGEDVLTKLEWVRVSLDSANAEQHLALKRNGHFEAVMSNIRSFSSLVSTVGVGYVVTSRNTENLEILLLRLLNLGAEYVQFRPVIDHPELETSLDLTYLKRYENNRFSVLIEGMHENLVEGNDNLPCVAHSLTTVITADGAVYLCGRLNIHPWFEPMGNVNEQPFRKIWLGEKRRLQARQVTDPGFCKASCPRCRITKFNQLLDRLTRTRTRNFI